MSRARLTRELYAWLVWVGFVAILYFLGSKHFHLPLQNMGPFVGLLALLCLLLLLALRFTLTSGEPPAPEQARDKGHGAREPHAG